MRRWVRSGDNDSVPEPSQRDGVEEVDCISVQPRNPSDSMPVLLPRAAKRSVWKVTRTTLLSYSIVISIRIRSIEDLLG